MTCMELNQLSPASFQHMHYGYRKSRQVAFSGCKRSEVLRSLYILTCSSELTSLLSLFSNSSFKHCVVAIVPYITYISSTYIHTSIISLNGTGISVQKDVNEWHPGKLVEKDGNIMVWAYDEAFTQFCSTLPAEH